ncbi:MAG: hypothetical protein II210_03880, partial [Rikenellaceae bacterium]|nr:hypothetical protein [Rikenellaceae bacterium]
MGEVVGIYALVTFVAALLLVATSMLYARIRQRQMVVRRTLERCYVSILNRRLLEGGDERCVFPLIERRSSRLLLATVVARIGSMTYGYDRRVMAEVV